jgi:hypothetical protein
MPAVLTMQLHRRSRATFAIDLGRLLTYTYDASNAPQLKGQGSVCVNPFEHQRATGHTFSRPRAAIAVSIECGGEVPTKVVGAPAPALDQRILSIHTYRATRRMTPSNTTNQSKQQAPPRW